MIRVNVSARYNVPSTAVENISVVRQSTGTHIPMGRAEGRGKLRPAEFYFEHGVYQLPIPPEGVRYQLRFRIPVANSLTGRVLTLMVPME